MQSAREINKKLDEILLLQDQINELESEVSKEATLKNVETGEPVTKDFVLSTASGVIQEIKDDLNKTTDNGRRVRDIFTNDYYINDMSQDKIIANKIKANKLAKEESTQNKQEN